MSKIRDFTTSYNQKNIVGPVSQSDGIPTGAIIERGSNGNGTYIKYADGTMIATFSTNINGGAPIAVGPFYKTTAGHKWTFPLAFAQAPIVNANAYWSDATASDAVQAFTVFDKGPGASTTSYATVRIMSQSNWSNLTFLVYYIAIGRWY